MSADKPKKKMTNVTYEERLTHYDSPEGMALLQRIANERGISATAALRQLVREEVRRRELGGQK